MLHNNAKKENNKVFELLCVRKSVESRMDWQCVKRRVSGKTEKHINLRISGIKRTDAYETVRTSSCTYQGRERKNLIVLR